MDNANSETVEFVYKHKTSTKNQEILMSSGSGNIVSTATIQILSDDTSLYDGKTVAISSSDGTGKTYIFDDDNDGATGTLDGSGRVRVQINQAETTDEIAGALSTSISHANGHAGKIEVSDYIQFLTSNGSSFITSDGNIFYNNSSGSLTLTQLSGSESGNKIITTNAPSSSVTGFTGGSDNQILWDLTVVPSSNSVSSSLKFRLNNSSNASSSMDSNAVSMSTDYFRMRSGELWNVMLQRMTGSISGSGTNEYKLLAALQDKDKITVMSTISMSVSGGIAGGTTTGGKGFYANQNWQSIGSRNTLSSSNLFVGRTLSGSLAEFRAWDIHFKCFKV